MRDYATGFGEDMPGEGTGSKLGDPAIDQDQEDRVPRRRPGPPPGTLQDRRVYVNPGIPKDLIHPFPADAIPCRNIWDAVATMIRRDNIPGVISRQLLHTPGLIGCQVIRRL